MSPTIFSVVGTPVRRTLPGPIAIWMVSLVALAPLSAQANGFCAHPSNNESISLWGDVDRSGVINVTDVQCGILGLLWQIDDGGQPMPPCLGGSLVRGDSNCDGLLDVADAQLIARRALGLPLPGVLGGPGLTCPTTCAPCLLPCDDGIACTVDSCEPATGCHHEPNHTQCDDGIACTVDVCAANGCEYDALDCDDDNPCTEDSCNPASGCAWEPLDCDDGVNCTVDVCVGGSCAHTPSDALCPEGSTCDPTIGDPATGCYTAAGSAFCDGPNAFQICTITTTTVHAASFSLPAGTYLTCSLRIAAISPACTVGNCRATGLQLNLEYDSAKGGIQNLYEFKSSPAVGWFKLTPLTPSTNFNTTSGHTISIAPGSTATSWNSSPWTAPNGETGNGVGVVLAVNLSNPNSPLTGASLGGAPGTDVTGTAEFFRIFFTPVAGYNPATDGPFRVCARGVTITNANTLDVGIAFDHANQLIYTTNP